MSATSSMLSGRVRRILVVDSSPEGKERCRGILEEAGYDTDGAVSGQEARYAAVRTPYDGVILEVQLPDVRGLALVRWFRRYFPAVPMVIYSAGADWGLYDRARRAGAQDVVSKLSPPGELVRAVGHCMGAARLTG
ncbi:MAG: response regulator [Planctomycetota bacterium]